MIQKVSCSRYLRDDSKETDRQIALQIDSANQEKNGRRRRKLEDVSLCEKSCHIADPLENVTISVQILDYGVDCCWYTLDFRGHSWRALASVGGSRTTTCDEFDSLDSA
mmetsp:Transcript_3142/g.5686  ORF Transcript_3142/g.5686 Transcript_3142/m.5686 type:complete len:109 (+) Transcript_3142:554-880(+)